MSNLSQLQGKERRLQPHWATLLYCSLGSAGGLGIFGKLTLISRVVPHVEFFGMFLGLVAIVAPFFYRLALRARLIIGSIAALTFLLFPLVVYPRVEQMHAVGRGSDQPDCIIVASHSLANLEWPYESSKMWSHDPLSCGPGWVALQMPLVQFAGYRWTLTLIMAGAFVAMFVAYGRDRFFSYLTLLALCPGVLIASADGTDFLTFGVATAALYACIPKGRSLLAIMITALIAQFRLVTMLLPVAFAARMGRSSASVAVGLVIATEAGFLLLNPEKFIDEGPMHLFFKLTGSHIPQLSPVLIVSGFVLLSSLLCYLALLQSNRLSVGATLSTYLCILFALPAITNLFNSFGRHGFTLDALGFWEGGNWIAGCIPLIATILTEQWFDNHQATIKRRVA